MIVQIVELPIQRQLLGTQVEQVIVCWRTLQERPGAQQADRVSQEAHPPCEPRLFKNIRLKPS